LVEEGFITELTLKFTPMGVTCQGIPDARIAAVEGSGLEKGVAAPLGVILAASDKGNLIPRRETNKKGKTGAKAGQPLPEKSLDPRDFLGSDAELLARAKLVAAKIGGAGLVGRVRTTGSFDGTITTSFKSWWDDATAQQRARALIAPSKGTLMSPADIARLGNLECPFRGIANFVVADAEGANGTSSEPIKARKEAPPVPQKK
jgi:hypothetical protein